MFKSTFQLHQSVEGLKAKGLSLRVDGIDSNTWSWILDYLYLRSLSVKLSDSELGRFYAAAKLLGIKNLANFLERFLKQLGLELDCEAIESKTLKIKIKMNDTDDSAVVDKKENLSLPPEKSASPVTQLQVVELKETLATSTFQETFN